MCQFSSTEDQRYKVINAILPIFKHIQYADEIHYPIMYKFLDIKKCIHKNGTCIVDKDNFIEMILESIKHEKWNLTKKMFTMWDTMLYCDLINSDMIKI